MALHFPEKPEIPLTNSPLAEVVCQVRYPPILRIAKEEPSELQDLIRHRFPEFGVEQPFRLQIPGVGNNSEPTAEMPPRLFRFQSQDGNTTATLTVDFYALSTNKYAHWSNFVDDLLALHQAVVQVYQPAYATRIGLRYINRLSRATTGLNELEDILGLVRPELTAMLLSDAWSDPDDWLSQLVVIDGDARLGIRTALNREDSEQSFLLDFDHFEQGKIALSELQERVNRYHSTIYRAFRWCLLDESLLVFNPGKIGAIEHDN